MNLDIPGIAPGDIEAAIAHINMLPKAEQIELMKLIDELAAKEEIKEKQDDFLAFAQAMDANFLVGEHHKIIARTIEKIATGELKRVIINIAPRHGKSHIMSYLFPAWFMGKFPDKKIIMASHTADLAVDFGRKVRNLVADKQYQEIFPDVSLQSDSKASGRWGTNHAGEYYACGVGGALAGRGAHLCIIDDPHSEQEAKTGNPAVFDSAYEWYQSGPRQRLMPGGAICLIMCMTGDTDVLMADGTSKKLRDIRVNDQVATYDDNVMATARIANWQSSGVDSVYTIQTQSGKMLHANERHPFLVDANGERKWIRLKDLQPGMALVSTTDAIDHLDPKQNQDYVPLAKQEKATTEKTQTHHIFQLAHMVNGKIKCVLNAAVVLFAQKGCATVATIKTIHPQKKLQNKDELAELSTDMASLLKTTKKWSKSDKTNVTYADNLHQIKIQEPIGMQSFVSIIATKLARCVDYCATTATWLWDMVKPPKRSEAPLHTYSFTTDQITSIIYKGEEEVFDVEVERTENFIANGVVSHNTRWGKRDLTGRILDNMMKNEGSDQWEVIELPMELPNGEPLWPEFWTKKDIEALKNTLDTRYWMAQYQQQPTSEGAAIVKREWWQRWEKEDPPECEYIIQSWDTAFEKSTRADYSACTTWGVFYQVNEVTGLQQANIILLDAYKERLEFPELKVKAFQMYKEYNPDNLLIEKKASGAPLIYELRAMGILVSEVTPTKDKITRLNAVADLFSSGMVWAPDTRWAEKVIEEVADFPVGEFDDLVDSVTQALSRFRRGGFITLDTDYEDEVPDFKSSRAKLYSV